MCDSKRDFSLPSGIPATLRVRAIRLAAVGGPADSEARQIEDPGRIDRRGHIRSIWPRIAFVPP